MSYTVSIIPQNLSKQETIVQIAEVLNHLTNITEDIFKRVNNRIENNNKILNDLQERVNTVNSKINKLKGAKKATQVFSSSKYPASHVNREYVSIFKDVEKIEMKKHKIKLKPEDLTTSEPMDKLQVYHVKLSHHESKKRLEGLGKMPTDVECVNDLLLYNSGKNLYRNFVMSDALKGPQHIREEDTIVTTAIGAAPRSISERSTLTRSTTHSYFYTPKIGEVPELDVPLDLPDLPGIADDLRYENTQESAIAPSVLSQTLNDLPAFETIENIEKKEEKITENLPLPPPPPPPVEAPAPPPPVELTKVETKIVEEVKLPVPVPPPPPPPPPPPAAVEAPVEVPKDHLHRFQSQQMQGLTLWRPLGRLVGRKMQN